MTHIDTNSMSLEDWLCYLESIDPNKIELGLERVRVVAKKMQLTSFKDKKVIEVAGTNGKGSTCKFLATALLKSGYSVGLYTSPHLIRFQERININGTDIDSNLLSKAFSEIYKCAQSLNIKLTYFEFTTLAALYAFKLKDVDFIILEVGLGGRLDAVNIVDADIAIICSIGLDHTQILGSSLEKIAFEKAGIIKDNKVCILGQIQDAALDTIVACAKAKNTKLFIENTDFNVSFSDRDNTLLFSSSLNIEKGLNNISNTIYKIPKIPRLCTGIALFTLYYLQDCGFNIEAKAIDYAIDNASMPCRLQKVLDKPSIYIDVSHNEPAAKNLSKFLSSHKVFGLRRAVIAMLKDKDIESVIDVLHNNFDRWYVASTKGARGESYTRLSDAIATHDDNLKNIKGFETVEDALDSALLDSTSSDEIVVFGSFVTASKAYIHLHIKDK